MDGSTDISGDEQETLYIRSSVNGEVTEIFLFIGSPSSTKSADLFEFVKNVFKCTGLDSENRERKLVGMGSDGVSNMLGCKAGLVTLMKNDYPELIGIHCLCHRLELSFRDVLKNNTYHQKNDDISYWFELFLCKA